MATALAISKLRISRGTISHIASKVILSSSFNLTNNTKLPVVGRDSGGLKTPELRHENSIRLSSAEKPHVGSPLKNSLARQRFAADCFHPRWRLCRIGSLATRLRFSFEIPFESGVIQSVGDADTAPFR